MNQSRIGSLIESLVNIAIGFGINLWANMVILPWFGFPVSLGTAFHIGCAFTVISVIRSYAIRRWFNSYLHRMAEAAASAITHKDHP